MKLSYPLAFLAMIGMAVAMPTEPTPSKDAVSAEIKEQQADDLIHDAKEEGKDGAEEIGDALKKTTEAFKKEGEVVGDKTAEAAKNLRASLNEKKEKATEAVAGAANQAGEAAAGAANRVGDAATTAYQKTKKAVLDAPANAKKLSSDAAQLVKDAWNGNTTLQQNYTFLKPAPKVAVAAGVVYLGHKLVEHLAAKNKLAAPKRGFTARTDRKPQ